MHTAIHDSLDSIPAEDWNRLVRNNHPFLRHEFLAALEHQGCVGKNMGWVPQHITLHDDQDQLIGACPLYLKYNSYGEFVFDWSWAEAYERAGLAYYPKLVSAIPYTPATGQRLLVDPDRDFKEIADVLIEAVIEHAKNTNVSSLHWLFPLHEEIELLKQHKLMQRIDCQFHWRNNDYNNFDDFLQSLTSKKRKQIKRERRLVRDAGLEIIMINGDEANDEQIEAAAWFYRSIYTRKYGTPTLNLGFFQEIARTMGEQLILILANHQGQYVACAICFRGDNAFYGRHWGCNAEFHSLHFELCYYQGIEYCIREDIQLFEPGAQGEHKISRGFLPVITRSAHWIQHEGFRGAIQDFLDRETTGINHYAKTLMEHSPYKSS